MSIARLRNVLQSSFRVRLQSTPAIVQRLNSLAAARRKTFTDRGQAPPPSKQATVVNAIGSRDWTIRPIDLLHQNTEALNRQGCSGVSRHNGRLAPIAMAACAMLVANTQPTLYAAELRGVERDQNPIQPEYTIRARVPLATVDITVTDSKGNAVHGLQQSDFTILEDGKEMKANSFEEHRSEEVPLAPTLVKQAFPPNTFTNSMPTAPNSAPLNVLLLDDLNTGARRQMQVTQQTIDFVNNMKPGTQIAIFRLATRLSILQGFTSDKGVLKAALSSEDNFDWPSPVMDIIPGDEPATSPGDAVEKEGKLAAIRGERTFLAMRQIALYLAGMPGRKNLIWLSGSFPLQFPPVLNPQAFPSTAQAPQCTTRTFCQEPDPAPQMYDFTADLRAATGLLTQAHVVLYTIDQRGPELLARGNRAYMASSERGTMQDMADQTGGKFFSNENDYVGAIQQSIDLGSNFYTLTYAPTDQALDTRFRTIKVKVDQPNLHLDYRNGYYAVDPTTYARGKLIETVSPMKMALMRGALDATQILFKVKATEAPATEVSLPTHNVPDPKLMKPPYRHYSITYTIDLSSIQFTPAPDGTYRAAFELGIRVYNANGDEIVNSASKQAHPILTRDAYQSLLKTGAISHDEIDVPAKGDFFLRVAIHDLTNDRIGSLEIPTASIKLETVPVVASQK